MAEKGGTKILAIITICIMLVTILFSGCIDQAERNGKHKIINIDPNKEILFLTRENSSKYYTGEVGPFIDEYDAIVFGADITLFINENQYFGKTNAIGISHLTIPQDIINSTDLSQKYKIKATHNDYHDLSWKVKIEIKNE